MNAIGTGIAFDPARAANRQVWIRKKNGDVVGSNFTVPKGDFSRFLGYKAPTKDEESGKQPVSSDRVLEIAMQRSMKDLGSKAMQSGSAMRNMYISHGKYENKPGREKDMIKDGMDSIQQSLELNQSSNMAYLEMQYKFQWASKSFGVVSNLMKVRNEATKKAIAEVR